MSDKLDTLKIEATFGSQDGTPGGALEMNINGTGSLVGLVAAIVTAIGRDQAETFLNDLTEEQRAEYDTACKCGGNCANEALNEAVALMFLKEVIDVVSASRSEDISDVVDQLLRGLGGQ